jgi:hypothetical protein
MRDIRPSVDIPVSEAKAASGNLLFSPSVISFARLAIESGCKLHRNRSIGGNLSHQVYLTRAGDAAGVDLNARTTILPPVKTLENIPGIVK